MYVRRYPELWLWMHRRWREVDGAASVKGMFPRASPRRTDAVAGSRFAGRELEARLQLEAATLETDIQRLVIRAPNWLGDARHGAAGDGGGARGDAGPAADRRGIARRGAAVRRR